MLLITSSQSLEILKTDIEPINDLDTIYKVLKKAGEMSAAAEKAQATTPMMEIPVVNINVPDYPDREPAFGGATSRGPLKPSQASKQGLSAPMADVSSSGRVMMIIFHFNFSLLPLFPISAFLSLWST